MPYPKPTIWEYLALPFRTFYWRFIYEPRRERSRQCEASACWSCRFAGNCDPLKSSGCGPPGWDNWRVVVPPDP